MKSLFATSLVLILMTIPARADWVNVTGALAGQKTACGGVYCMAAVPKQNRIIIGISGGVGLYATTDNGETWQPLGKSTGWVDSQDIVFDKDNPDIFWESGIHGGQIHHSDDGGKTFTVFSGPGTNNCDGVAVDMTDPQRATIVAGCHEGSSVSKSTDGGKTWTKITANITGETSFPIVFDAKTYIVAGGGGIWRTTDGGNQWTKVSSEVAAWEPLVLANGTVYFIANGNQSIITSTDQGVTWTTIAKPGDHGYCNYSPVEMPDGSVVAIGRHTLVQTKDGKTWNPIGSPLPEHGMRQGNLIFNRLSGSFFIAYWNCTTTIPAESIWKLDFAPPELKKP